MLVIVWDLVPSRLEELSVRVTRQEPVKALASSPLSTTPILVAKFRETVLGLAVRVIE